LRLVSHRRDKNDVSEGRKTLDRSATPAYNLRYLLKLAIAKQFGVEVWLGERGKVESRRKAGTSPSSTSRRNLDEQHEPAISASTFDVLSI
jgi:hypothetical protein